MRRFILFRCVRASENNIWLRVRVDVLHLLYHLFMAAISLHCAHQNCLFLIYLLLLSSPPSLQSQLSLSRTPLPSSLLLSGGPSPLLPLSVSLFLLLYSAVTSLPPALLKLRLSLHWSSLPTPSRIPVCSFFPPPPPSIHSAAALSWKLQTLGVRGTYCTCLCGTGCVCVCATSGG